MIVSLDFIKEFITLKKTPEQIADKITLSLSEVEKIEKRGEDTILEIENKALTHRPDCFSELGLAREIGAYFNIHIKDPLKSYYDYSFKKPKKTFPLTVEIKQKDLCPRYTTIVLTNIKVGESPEFIKNRLLSVGIRPINNVVDITNYVMMELGQPLHAYDYDKVKNHSIYIRRAENGETITTLDGIKRSLDDSMIVIADSKKPLLLGGIMGGQDSEVGTSTKTLILESATFNAKITRTTSKKVGLRTDGSTRFEKNLDPHLTKAGMVRTVELLQKYAGAEIASEFIDKGEPLPEKKVITVKASRINTVLGLNLSPSEIKTLLERLELATEIDKDNLNVTIPTYRRDLSMEADIAEEVARIYGYDEIPTTLPKGDIIPPYKNRSIELQYLIKRILSGLGMYETHLSSLVGKDTIEHIGNNPTDYVKLINPTNPEKEYFRKSLIESLLSAGNLNSKYSDEFSLFEVGRVYEKTKKGKQPIEKIKVGGLFVYPKKEESAVDFFKVKGIVEELLKQLGIQIPLTTPKEDVLYQKGVIGNIGEFGTLGKLNPELSSIITKEGNVYAFELDFSMLLTHQKGKHYHPISQNPPVIEDFTFEFKSIPQIGNLLQSIKQVNQLIAKIDLIDTYNRSVTVRIYFQDLNKSLSTKDIEPIRDKLIDKIKTSFEGVMKAKD